MYPQHENNQLENSNHVLCDLLFQHGVLSVNPVDPVTYLKSLFF